MSRFRDLINGKSHIYHQPVQIEVPQESIHSEENQNEEESCVEEEPCVDEDNIWKNLIRFDHK